MTDGLAIRTRDLTRRFGRLVAVNAVTLNVPRAQIYGFLGPNGSGKSTTIRMLCGLLTPSAGEVEVLGYPMPRGAEAIRPRVGYMTQRFSLYEDLSVAENLDFMGEIYALPYAERKRRVDELLDEYRLVALRDSRAATLSGGESQRLALAAATLHRPELLFLDEPTSAVDPQSRRDFWESLFRLVDGGTTILVSTHYMDEAERCHRLAILDHGFLVADGPPRQLMAEIDATVVEIEAEEVRAARAALDRVAEVRSVAQLGTRLHALMDRALPDPAQRLAAALTSAGIQARVELAAPSLEDVFVAATRARAKAQP